MSSLSISDIRRAQDECIDIDEWVHPAEISGYDAASARVAAIERAQDLSPDSDFNDTPDTLITDHLRRCLDRRRELVSAGKQIPPGLQVSPFQYIDALIFLVLELESSYACYGLGSALYQQDEFLCGEHASEVLEKLRGALFKASNQHQWDMVRDIILEIFQLAYPWTGERIRFQEWLSESERSFLIDLLRGGPKSRPLG
jgi:hypothetical protein